MIEINKISQLPELTALQDADILVAVRGNATYRFERSLLRDHEILRFSGGTVGNSTSARWMMATATTLAAATAPANTTRLISGVTGQIKRLIFTLDVALATADLTITVQVNDVDQAFTASLAHGGLFVATGGAIGVTEGQSVGVKLVASAADGTTSSPRCALVVVPTS